MYIVFKETYYSWRWQSSWKISMRRPMYVWCQLDMCNRPHTQSTRYNKDFRRIKLRKRITGTAQRYTHWSVNVYVNVMQCHCGALNRVYIQENWQFKSVHYRRHIREAFSIIVPDSFLHIVIWLRFVSFTCCWLHLLSNFWQNSVSMWPLLCKPHGFI